MPFKILVNIGYICDPFQICNVLIKKIWLQKMHASQVILQFIDFSVEQTELRENCRLLPETS